MYIFAVNNLLGAIDSECGSQISSNVITLVVDSKGISTLLNTFFDLSEY